MSAVEWKKLGDVCTFQRGSVITEKDAVFGDIPVLSGGQKPAYYHDQFNRQGETIVVAGSGAYAGFVSFWDIPVFLSDSFSVNPSNILNTKYVFYFLKNIQDKIFATKKGSGVPHVHGSSIAKFDIPIPSLAKQQEIVSHLDTFTTLISNLESELDMRRKQYEHYRNQLLDFEGVEGVEWRTLGKVCLKTENIKWKNTSNDYFYIDLSSVERESNRINDVQIICKDNAPSRAQQIVLANDILFGTTRPTLKRLCIVPQEHDNQICSTGFCVLRADTNVINYRLLYYLLTTTSFYTYVENNQEGAGYPSISNSKIMKYEVPIPSLTKQAEIVEKLDAFEHLLQSLEQEIKLRKQQYEYYREKLLTFE